MGLVRGLWLHPAGWVAPKSCQMPSFLWQCVCSELGRQVTLGCLCSGVQQWMLSPCTCVHHSWCLGSMPGTRWGQLRTSLFPHTTATLPFPPRRPEVGGTLPWDDGQDSWRHGLSRPVGETEAQRMSQCPSIWPCLGFKSYVV